MGKQKVFRVKTIPDIYIKITVKNKTLQIGDPNVENASIIGIKWGGGDATSLSQLILNMGHSLQHEWVHFVKFSLL